MDREGGTAQKMNLFTKDFFRKCDHIYSFLSGKLHFFFSVEIRAVIWAGDMQIEFARIFNGLKEASLQQMFF